MRRRRFTLQIASAVLIAGFCSVVALSGCEPSPAKSKVANGQLYASGTARYDAVFQRIHATQTQSTASQDEKRASRKPLILLLALSRESEDRAVLAALAKRASALGGQGIRLDVTTSDAKCVMLHGTKHDKELTRAIEESARLELGRKKRLRARIADLEDLDGEIEHANLDAKRDSQGKAQEIRRELSAGSAANKRTLVTLRAQESEVEEYLGSLAFSLAPARAKPRPPAGTPTPPATSTPPVPASTAAPAGTDTPRTIEPLPPPPLPPPTPPRLGTNEPHANALP